MIILSVLIAVPVTGYFLLFQDALSPRDADLRVMTWNQVPDQQNGFVLVNLGPESIRFPEGIEGFSRFEEGWDPELALTALSDNEAILGKLDSCLALPEFQIPRVEIGGDISFLNSWHPLVRLACLRVGVLLDRGEVSQAFEQALKIAEFGRRIVESRSSTIFYLFGVGFETTGTSRSSDSSSGSIPTPRY